MRKGKQTGLSDALRSLTSRMDSRSGRLIQIKSKEAWAEVAGPMALSHTTGAHVRGNELVVFVDNNAWATELTALSEAYRKAIEEKIGKGAISSIRFTVSRKVAEELRIQSVEQAAEVDRAADKVPSEPLNEQERMQVEASVASIPNESLREAVLRATIADLEWKKGLANAKCRERA